MMKSVRAQLKGVVISTVVVAAFFLARGLPPETSLHVLASRGHMEAMCRNLRWGVSPNARNTFLETPLHIAAALGRPGAMTLLLHVGADLEARDGDDRTPLMCSWLAPQAMRVLLNAGADTHARAQLPCLRECTVLHLAACSVEPNAVELLLHFGAAPDARDEIGQTPLHWGAKRGRIEVLKSLLLAADDVNVPDESGRTPLHLAAKAGQFDVIRLLVARGADPVLRDKGGRRPIDLARDSGEKGTDKVVEFLAGLRESPSEK